MQFLKLSKQQSNRVTVPKLHSSKPSKKEKKPRIDKIIMADIKKILKKASDDQVSAVYKTIGLIMSNDDLSERESLEEIFPAAFGLLPKKSRKRKLGDVEEEGLAPKRKKKQKTGPKRPLSSYMCFVKAERDNIVKENPDAKFKEISKIMGDKWKSLTDKSPYEAMAAEDKQRYQRELETAA